MNDIQQCGHSLSDYKAMFALTAEDCKGYILDCYSGPASFNTELTALGGKVVSSDPLYAEPIDQLKKIVARAIDKQLSALIAHQDHFVWTAFHTPQALVENRKKHIEQFFLDLPVGLSQQRYQAKTINELDFPHFHFDLALCSHYLFAHSLEQSIDFHVNLIKKLCVLAKEVRIFPMINTLGEIPSLLGPVMLALSQSDYGVEVKSVPYQLQKNANTMLRVWAQTCVVENT